MTQWIDLNLVLFENFILICLTVGLPLLVVSQYPEQLWNGIAGRNHVFNVDSQRMKLVSMKKGEQSDPLYRRNRKNKTPDVMVDPVSYNVFATIRWGSRPVQFKLPWDMFAKGLIGLAGQQDVAGVALRTLPKDGEARTKALEQIQLHYPADVHLDGKKFEDVIKHNELLHLVAEANIKNALKMIKVCGRGDDKELNRLASKFVILPINYQGAKTAAATELVAEVRMATEYTLRMFIRTKMLALPWMLQNCPDTTTGIEIYGRMDQDAKGNAQAEGKDNGMLKIAIGALVVAIVIIAVVAMFALSKLT